MSVLLDTHVWLWWLTPGGSLSSRERATLDDEAGRGGLFIAAISLWEAQMLHAKNRLQLPMEFVAWLKQAAAPQMLTVLPLDVEVVSALHDLPTAFHGDPADRLIVASARAAGLSLATHDTNIRRSRTVRLWKPHAAGTARRGRKSP